MGIVNTIKSFLGISEKMDFDDSDSDLLVKLQDNREIVLRKIIPTRLMHEFMNFIYPDHHLKLMVKDIYHTYHNYLVSEESRRVYLQYALRLSLSTKGFGRRLILHHNIDPEVIVRTMLADTETELTEKT